MHWATGKQTIKVGRLATSISQLASEQPNIGWISEIPLPLEYWLQEAVRGS